MIESNNSKDVLGGWWVSNPRPPEPQSGALTNWATATILINKYYYLNKSKKTDKS